MGSENRVDLRLNVFVLQCLQNEREVDVRGQRIRMRLFLQLTNNFQPLFSLVSGFSRT